MTVARLTQATTFMWLATSCVLAVWAWDESNLTAIALTTLFVGAHVWFLGLQFGAINWLNRAETAEAATPRELIVAWWIESLMAMRVFAWHQPFRSRAEPDFLANNRKRGVVLVHGFCCNRGVWNPWIKHMRAQGHSCIAVNLEPVFASIDQYAPIIDAAVRAAYQATGCAPLLVGHSMGGLAIRAWQRTSAGGAHRAFHTVTIGSPHHGTWLGRFSHVKNGKQMRFQSPWLMQLTADEASAREKLGIIGHDHGLSPRVTCWYSNSDNIVLPASSATLAYADNRLVRGVAHLALAFHPPIIDHCLHLLEHAEPPSKLTKSTTPPCR